MRPTKAPRLYLRDRPGRPETWVIVDRGREISLSLRAGDKTAAEERLRQYCVEAGKAPGESDRLHGRKGTVYFISTEEVPNFPIKIGIAWQAAELRTASINTHCPYQLEILASFEGTLWHERILHERFAADRLRGEWFKRSVNVMRFLLELRTEPVVSVIPEPHKPRPSLLRVSP
jgi:hypothetical protein